jgi:hypothetical protein
MDHRQAHAYVELAEKTHDCISGTQSGESHAERRNSLPNS